MKILGISAYYHDSAACLVDRGAVVAAAQEERFTRIKHDAGFPHHAIGYCLAEGGVGADGVDAVAFYDKPLLKLHRILETSLAVAPRGLAQFLRAVPLWLKDRLWVAAHVEEALGRQGLPAAPLYYPEHHTSHAASAFYPSPFAEAAILTVDGVGEWATAAIGVGRGHRLELVEQLDFPHSLGLLYSAFTYFCGFRVNSGEYKLMGLAPYGEPVYREAILDELVDLKDDGSFRLDLSFFDYLTGLRMTGRRFARRFGGPPRRPEDPVTRRERDLAASIQAVTEEIVLALGRHARRVTGQPRLCLAGGVALNCVANGALARSGLFEELWIQPAAGDAGGALGAALAVWHDGRGEPRRPVAGDAMAGAYLGPEFPAGDIRRVLDARGLPYRRLDEAEWAGEIARLLAAEQVVGLFQGRMELGPRALGNRSILADPRSPRMQSVLNRKIKFRESFRPFAPAVLVERAAEVFELDRPSPYMLLTAPVRAERRLPARGDEADLPLAEWVSRPRSDVPAVTHVDGSARVQTVHRETNPRFHRLLEAFDRATGCPVLINTSFNVRGEPIVCTPDDAYRCFMATDMDYLVLEDCLLAKTEQPDRDSPRWQREFAPD
jgi:carbamoyltransferase